MKSVNIIGDVMLAIFLSMALMSIIKLWEVADLALRLLVIIAVQVLFVALFCVFVLFRLLGKNYDAAVLVGGFAGHGLGSTPNAIGCNHVEIRRFSDGVFSCSHSRRLPD